ncbi:MAG: hypothetical protein GWN20_13165, partial [Phycisphaerae bacterium]|nr:hypothetical protein [Phycisphaerae bacterium]
IVHKTIVKDSDKRYQNAKELLSDLEALKKVHHPQQREKRLSIRISKLLQGIFAVVSLLALLSIGYLLIRPHDNKGFQIKRTAPLTTAPGLEQDPAWSPEGTRIAYASDESGNMDIWVRQIVAGQRLNLTRDYKGYDGKPVWSPNGEWIAFVSDRDGGGIFMMPA